MPGTPPIRLIAFNKPFGVICQFSREGKHATLADFISVPGVYPAGRLDTDSEGLLLLTNHGPLQHRISHPASKLPKTYWVQVENLPTAAALTRLARGIDLGDHRTQPCEARLIAAPPDLWPRHPPIRTRKAIPTAWIEVVLREGKNRQVRRMTAAVGHPTLRLIRGATGTVTLAGLAPGAWRDIDPAQIGYATGCGPVSPESSPEPRSPRQRSPQPTRRET